jgi:hypothetical protein
MICVYPAGPIQGKDLLTSLRNINAGMDWTARLRERGFSPFPVFCDYADIMRTKGVRVEGEGGVYEMSLAWMRHADCIFMLPGWEESKGACEEKRVAENIGIPVFTELEALMGWRKETEDE